MLSGFAYDQDVLTKTKINVLDASPQSQYDRSAAVDSKIKQHASKIKNFLGSCAQDSTLSEDAAAIYKRSLELNDGSSVNFYKNFNNFTCVLNLTVDEESLEEEELEANLYFLVLFGFNKIAFCNMRSFAAVGDLNVRSPFQIYELTYTHYDSDDVPKILAGSGIQIPCPICQYRIKDVGRIAHTPFQFVAQSDGSMTIKATTNFNVLLIRRSGVTTIPTDKSFYFDPTFRPGYANSPLLNARRISDEAIGVYTSAGQIIVDLTDGSYNIIPSGNPGNAVTPYLIEPHGFVDVMTWELFRVGEYQNLNLYTFPTTGGGAGVDTFSEWYLNALSTARFDEGGIDDGFSARAESFFGLSISATDFSVPPTRPFETVLDPFYGVFAGDPNATHTIPAGEGTYPWTVNADVPVPRLRQIDGYDVLDAVNVPTTLNYNVVVSGVNYDNSYNYYSWWQDYSTAVSFGSFSGPALRERQSVSRYRRATRGNSFLYVNDDVHSCEFYYLNFPPNLHPGVNIDGSANYENRAGAIAYYSSEFDYVAYLPESSPGVYDDEVYVQELYSAYENDSYGEEVRTYYDDRKNGIIEKELRQDYLWGWLHVSNGRHVLQGYYSGNYPAAGEPSPYLLYKDGHNQDILPSLAAQLGCDWSAVAGMFMDIPSSVIQRLVMNSLSRT